MHTVKAPSPSSMATWVVALAIGTAVLDGVLVDGVLMAPSQFKKPFKALRQGSCWEEQMSRVLP